MKRTLSLFVLLGMVAVALTACNKAEEQPPVTEPSTNAPAADAQ